LSLSVRFISPGEGLETERQNLTLRRTRSVRLEGLATTRLLPPFETPRFARLLRVR
jgi:hypothetical protein